MTGWDGYGHAVPTGLPIDRYLGSGDLQDAENCGYAPVAVLREMGVDHAHGDPQIQYRDGRIVLLDGTVLERGGTLNCVWAVTGLPGLDHSGVAGERSDSQIASTPSGTPVPAPTPTDPSAALTTGCVVVPDEAVEAARTTLAESGLLAGSIWADEDGAVSGVAQAIVHRVGPLIAAQALRDAVGVLEMEIGKAPGLWGPQAVLAGVGDALDWFRKRADELERGGDQ